MLAGPTAADDAPVSDAGPAREGPPSSPSRSRPAGGNADDRRTRYIHRLVVPNTDMADSPPSMPRLEAALPPSPGAWERYDEGSAVQYRLPGDDGPDVAAKLTVRPDHLGSAAVRVDRIAGCRRTGTTRHADVDAAADAVDAELAAVLAAIT